MSVHVSLIEYKNCNEDKLYEENAKIIESAFISSAIWELLRDKFPLSEREIFEEEGSPELSKVDYILESKIHEIKELLENEFVRLIETRDSQDLKSLITSERVYDAIEKFRTLTNVHHIFWLKNQNFFKQDNVLIQLG